MKNYFKNYNIELDGDIFEKFNQYGDKLLEYNKLHNLTSIESYEKMAIWHFLDSVLIYNTISNYIKDGYKIIDMGTGGGFPGMVFSILNKNIEITMVDSVQKKIKFLNIIKNNLKIDNCFPIHHHLTANNSLNKKFDIVISRAFMKPKKLFNFSKNYVKKGGVKFFPLTENQKNSIEYINGKYSWLEYPFEGKIRYVLAIFN